MTTFDSSILKVIEKLSYEFFVVNLNPEVKCVCIKDATAQADPTCKKCLGTGFKIKIKQVTGASQDSGIPQTIKAGNQFIIAKNYYIKNDYVLNNDDIIVDNDEVYFVYQKSNLTSFKGNKVYQKCSCIIKKLDSISFMKNFNEIVGR